MARSSATVDAKGASALALAHIGTDRQCKATRHNGERCRKVAVRGGRVCTSHGGNMVLKRVRREEAGKRVRNLLGVPRDVDPFTALLEQVCEAAGNVEYLRAMVQEIREKPRVVEETDYVRTVKPGIYGPDHLGDQAPHVLLKLYGEERDRLARIAKLAIDSGIAERQVRIYERQGEIIARIINSVIEDERMELTEGKRVLARSVASEALRKVDLVALPAETA